MNLTTYAKKANNTAIAIEKAPAMVCCWSVCVTPVWKFLMRVLATIKMRDEQIRRRCHLGLKTTNTMSNVIVNRIKLV